MGTELFEMDLAPSSPHDFSQFDSFCHASLEDSCLQNGDVCHTSFCTPMEAEGFVMVRDPNATFTGIDSQVAIYFLFSVFSYTYYTERSQLYFVIDFRVRSHVLYMIL